MRQRVFVIVEGDSDCGDPRCPGKEWREFGDVASAQRFMDEQTGLSCVLALGGETIEDVRPSGGASAIASQLATMAGRRLSRGTRKRR